MLDPPWYENEESLLQELKAHQRANLAPELPGYADFVEIARGGQGVVYRARQCSTDRDVAIKVLYEGPADVVRSRIRFEREVELAALLQHPNIVRIYDGGATGDGRLYVVMEFVEGVPLDEFVSPITSGAPSTAEWVSLFRSICDGVSHAHRRGVIHRDLKPSNLLVTADGVPYILDFGIARSTMEAGDASTKTGEFVGTLAFAAPEQLTGGREALDVRSDVYALGVMLYRLLAGQPPYDTQGPLADIVTAIRSQVPEPPSSWSHRSNADLDAIAGRALAKDPDDRYSNVDALAEDLRRYQEGEALLARSDRKWYILAKVLRRHRLKVATATAILGVLLLFSATTTALWRRAVRAQERTNEIKVFWEDTLGSISSGENRLVTFQEVLDEAVHWVAITTEDEPDIEASLRLTIGNGYRCIGEFDKAARQLEQAIEIRRALFGEDHADLIQSMNALAILRGSERKFAEAQQLFEQALSARERLFGKEHPEVAQSLQNLGRLFMETEKLDEAEACFAQARAIRERHFPADDPAIATVLFNQGDLAARRFAWSEAVELHRQALLIRTARLTDTHPDVARSLVALARVKRAESAELDSSAKEKALAEVHELGGRALAIRRRTLPRAHPLIREVERLLE